MVFKPEAWQLLAGWLRSGATIPPVGHFDQEKRTAETAERMTQKMRFPVSPLADGFGGAAGMVDTQHDFGFAPLSRWALTGGVARASLDHRLMAAKPPA